MICSYKTSNTFAFKILVVHVFASLLKLKSSRSFIVIAWKTATRTLYKT